MSDPELAQDILVNIMVAIERVERRFVGIDAPDDFLSDDEGIDRLDGIAMMLIAVGEQVKRLDGVISMDLNAHYPEVDWKGVKGIRDFLSHHYFIIDAEVIFDVCQNKLATLKQAIQDMQHPPVAAGIRNSALKSSHNFAGQTAHCGVSWPASKPLSSVRD